MRVDEEFRAIMLGIGDDQRIFSLLRVPQLAESLEAILDQLERCQKALADFLEQKRQAFPRFYFIGDDDLLEVHPATIEIRRALAATDPEYV